MKRICILIIFIDILYNGFAQDSLFDIVNIKVYINNHEIEGPFYRNVNEPSLYINLINIFELISYETKVNNNIEENTQNLLIRTQY